MCIQRYNYSYHSSIIFKSSVGRALQWLYHISNMWNSLPSIVRDSCFKNVQKFQLLTFSKVEFLECKSLSSFVNISFTFSIWSANFSLSSSFHLWNDCRNSSSFDFCCSHSWNLKKKLLVIFLHVQYKFKLPNHMWNAVTFNI